MNFHFFLKTQGRTELLYNIYCLKIIQKDVQNSKKGSECCSRQKELINNGFSCFRSEGLEQRSTLQFMTNNQYMLQSLKNL